MVAAAAGDYGKPRPYVVAQSDAVTTDSVVLCPVTSDVQAYAFRLVLEPSTENGLRRRSEVMVEKILAVRTDRVVQTIGRISSDQLSQLEARLSLVLGLRG